MYPQVLILNNDLFYENTSLSCGIQDDLPMGLPVENFHLSNDSFYAACSLPKPHHLYLPPQIKSLHTPSKINTVGLHCIVTGHQPIK